MRVNIGFPVMRTDGRAYGHVITTFSRMGRLPHFLSYGAPTTRALRARVELRYKYQFIPFGSLTNRGESVYLTIMRQRAYVKISGKREVWGVRVALVADGMTKFKLSTS